MNTGDETQTFLRDGYERYADAKEAVTEFERQLQGRLMQQLEDKLDWANFSARRGERGRGKAVYAGIWDNPGRPSVWACNYDSRGYSVELGVRWKVHKTGRPFLYTTRWEPRFRKLHVNDPASPVQNHEGHLIVVVDDGFDLDAMCALLLRETDRALAGMKVVG